MGSIEEPSSNVDATYHILGLLNRAAFSNAKLSFLERGWDNEPTVVTYAQLKTEAEANARLLRRAGLVQPGSITISYFDNHKDNVIWFWSIAAAGGVPAILNAVSNEPRTAEGQLDNIKNLFSDTPVLTRHKLSSIFASRGLNVRTVEQLDRLNDTQNEENPVLERMAAANDTAVILFTSGSTGHSKAVQYSHTQLVSSVLAKVDYLRTDGKVFMNWTSFDHSASFCEVHLQAMHALGDQVFVPASDLMIEPFRFFSLLSRFKVGYTFAPNFFLAAAVRSMKSQDKSVHDTIDLSSLAVIMCGGEANKTSTLEETDKLMQKFGAPKSSIKAAYGLSETCSACFYSLSTPQYDIQNSNTFATVGGPLPAGIEVKIVRIADDDRAADEGTIYLRGPVLFKGYHNNADATAACMTSDGWMNTGDIGKIDASGNLHLLGRAKEILILNGQNYSSFEIEHALESSSIPGVTPSYNAVFSTWNEANDSESVVVLFNPTEAAIGPRNLRATLQAIDKCVFTVCAQKALHIIPLPKSLMPKSTIGKLSRSKLKQRFEAGAFDDFLIQSETTKESESKTVRLEDLPPLQQEIAIVYAEIVGVSPNDLLGSDALLSSGINSMGFMRLKKALEKRLKIHQEIPMPLLIRSHSIASLEHELTLLGTLPQQYDPVVPLVREGSKQPLFLLHPGAGEFLCWIGLLKYLPDRPIYALRAKGLHPGEGTFAGLDDLLDCYYTAIRDVQPHGPYAMMGYCFGGLLSFELSKKFQAAGETVVFCAGIDNPPSLKSTIGQVRYRSLMIDILPVVTDYTDNEARAFAEETAYLSDEEFYALLFTKFSPEFIENMDITVPRLQAFGRVEDCMRLIAAAYEPSGTVETMDIFCADPMPHFGATPEAWRKDVLSGWKQYVDGENVRFHDVQGTHISLIKEPLIADFQRVVNEALAARGI